MDQNPPLRKEISLFTKPGSTKVLCITILTSMFSICISTSRPEMNVGLILKRKRIRCFATSLKSHFVIGCSLVNLHHIFRTSLNENTYERLLLGILRISPYSVQMRENTNQNNSEYGHLLRSVEFQYEFSNSEITYLIKFKTHVKFNKMR